MKVNIGGLIGVISIVISLLVVAIVLFTTIETRRQGKASIKTMTAPLDRARGVDCLARLRKVEMAIQAYYTENEKFPRSLGEISLLGVQDLRCPVTGEQYAYDSLTGKITHSCRY